MDKPAAKPGRRDGSATLMIVLGGVILGIAAFVAFGIKTSLYGVAPFLLGGGIVGGVGAALWRKRTGGRR